MWQYQASESTIEVRGIQTVLGLFFEKENIHILWAAGEAPAGTVG